MSESIVTPSAEQPLAPVVDPTQVAIERAGEFLANEVPILSKLTGLHVNVRIGKGWATDLETGDFTVDPAFFIERGYTAEHSVYATLHELLAHVRDAKRDPDFAARQRVFSRKGNAEHLFSNILSDIHGNKMIHRLLPRQADVAAELYDQKLFPLEADGGPVDYAALPLHIQFMYKMIRQEMIPDSNTPVRPEVDEALAGLRNFQGMGVDMIAYLTTPNSKMSGSDRFDQQLAVIYPVYLQLLEQSKQEAAQRSEEQQEAGADNAGQSEPEQTDGDHKDESFSEEYKDYFENKHPEPLSDEEKKNLKEVTRDQNDQGHDTKADTDKWYDRMLRNETGFGAKEHEAYAQEVDRHRNAIDEMREVYKLFIQERLALRRGLSRAAYTDGDLLDPNRLAQVVVDIKSGIDEPEAYQRYEERRSQAELSGKVDIIFLFDCSSSMDKNNRHKAAATSALIMLEALAGMERDIKEAEKYNNVELDLDIRTALYVFRFHVQNLKPLGPGLSDKERLSVHQSILSPSGGTADFLALEAATKLERSPDRKRLILAVSDGESDDPQLVTQNILKLRQGGDMVYGIGIQTEVKRYAPNDVVVNDPNDLAGVMRPVLEKALM